MKVPRVTLVQLVTVAVISMWIITNIADIFVKDYSPPEALNTAFLTVIAPLLVVAATKRGPKRDEDDATSGGDDDHQ